MQKYSHWSKTEAGARTHCILLCQSHSLYDPQSRFRSCAVGINHMQQTSFRMRECHLLQICSSQRITSLVFYPRCNSSRLLPVHCHKMSNYKDFTEFHAKLRKQKNGICFIILLQVVSFRSQFKNQVSFTFDNTLF